MIIILLGNNVHFTGILQYMFQMHIIFKSEAIDVLVIIIIYDLDVGVLFI